MSNQELLFSVLFGVSQALKLKIDQQRMQQLLEENQNSGMFYAVKSKPESLLYYPVFKLILSEGWVYQNQTEAFKDVILQ